MAPSSPLRILFVHHRSELGGAPASLSYLIANLDPEQVDAHVYCPPGESAELFRSIGATVHTGPVSSFTHIWASTYKGRRWLLFARELLLLPGHVAQFRRTLRHNRFDLVHLNDSPLIPAAWLARHAGLPVVWHLRSSLPGSADDLRSRLIRRAIQSFADVSVAINEDIARVFAVDSLVVPNTVDLDRFRPHDRAAAKTSLDLDPELPVVSYFGFIYPSKGFQEFIEAAALLRDRGVAATYIIVGGAVRGEEFFHTVGGRVLELVDLARNYERDARELVAKLDLDDRVRFLPFTRDTAAVYEASDIVVAPSRGPELGRPVIEAAASGVPVVATGSRTGGGIVIPNETGVLVAAGAEPIAGAIAELVANPERRHRLGEAARSHAESTFDPHANAASIQDLYRRIVLPEPIPVLYVHHRPQLGGAPSSLAYLIRNLSDRFEPHVLVPEGPAAALFAEAGAIVHIGPSAIFAHAWDNPYGGLRWLVLGREVANLPAHVRRLRALMRKHHFTIVHLNDSPLLAAGWIARHSGAHVIWHLRSALAGEGRDRRSRAIARLIDRWGDAAIAIDSDVAARFPIHLPLTIVHNSVDLPEAAPAPDEARRRLGLPLDRTLIGFAGFIRRPKGWPEFVAAAEILIRAGVPAHFVIMGGGVRPPEYFKTMGGRLLAAMSVLADEETAIKTLVESKGLSDSFSFLAFTPETSVVYSALDVVAFPNQGVGLGRPVLEAAMHGKPVVASGSNDGGGVLLDGVTGLLLHDRSPAGIASALRRLVEDPDLRARLGRQAAEHARASFDPVLNAREVEAVYDELLGLGGGEVQTLPARRSAPEPVTPLRRSRVGT